MSQLAVGPGTQRALCRIGSENGLVRRQKRKAPRAGCRKRVHVFITGDRNLTFQQNIGTLSIAVIVLEVEGIQLHHTLPLIPKVLALLPTLKPGLVVKVTK
jgi:hypothetical protein